MSLPQNLFLLMKGPWLMTLSNHNVEWLRYIEVQVADGQETFQLERLYLKKLIKIKTYQIYINNLPNNLLLKVQLQEIEHPNTYIILNIA